MNKEQAEKSNWQFAHTWYEGLNLEIAGVSIGDILAYDVMQVLGRIWLREEEQRVGSA